MEPRRVLYNFATITLNINCTFTRLCLSNLLFYLLTFDNNVHLTSTPRQLLLIILLPRRFRWKWDKDGSCCGSEDVCTCVCVWVKIGVLKLIENSFVGIDEDWSGRNDGIGSIGGFLENWIFKKWRVNFEIIWFTLEDKKDLKARFFLRFYSLSNILSCK